MIGFGRAEVPRIDLDELMPVKMCVRECKIEEFSNAMSLTSADDVIIGDILLEHHPHGTDIIRRVAPVPARLHVSNVELVLQSELDVRNRAGDLPRHESLAATWRLMVEQNPAGRMKAVTFAIV